MYHEQQDAGASTLLHPLNIDVAMLGQPDARSFTSPRAHADGQEPHLHQDGNQGVDTFQVPVPGGASILMKDSAGTSMSLNLGIDPSSGTPILSGRAIDAHGGILDVHPCSCSDPISPHHKLPGTPEHPRGGMHLRDHAHLHPSSKSPFGAHRRLVPTPTPLIVVQTLQTPMVHSPSYPEPQGGEMPMPTTSVDVLRSPFTPTPASMRRASSPINEPQEAFHTPPLGPEDTSAPGALESSPDSLLPARGVALTLNAIPEQSIFDPDSDSPLVQSPTADSVRSGPSALGPLPSLPSTPSHASEFSTRTVIPLHVQRHREEQLDTGLIANNLLLDDPALPGPSGDSNHATLGYEGPASIGNAHASNHQGSAVDSDLYTDRIIASMPVARVRPDGEELRYNLEAQPRPSPTQVCTRLPNLVAQINPTYRTDPKCAQVISEGNGLQSCSRTRWHSHSTSLWTGLASTTCLCPCLPTCPYRRTKSPYQRFDNRSPRNYGNRPWWIAGRPQASRRSPLFQSGAAHLSHRH